MEEEFRSIKGNGFGWVMSWIRIVENETLDERDVCDLIGAQNLERGERGERKKVGFRAKAPILTFVFFCNNILYEREESAI